MSNKDGKNEIGLASLLKTVNKKYGAGTVMDFGSDAPIGIETISTGLPSLDLILGGGFPKGRLIEIFGHEASGKTSLAYKLISQSQKEGKKSLYVDVENSFDPEYASDLGVNVKELFFSQPSTAEQALDIVNDFAKTGEIGVIVLDSIAALVPRADSEKEIDGSHGMAGRARILSRALPMIADSANKNGCTVVMINQQRANVGVMYGNPNVTTGGVAMKYAASVRMEVRASKAEERGGNEGQPVKVIIKKNKIAKPFRETELFLAFGKGFDETLDLIEVAKISNIVERSGAFYNFSWDTSKKYQGMNNLVEAILSEKDIYEKLKKSIDNFIKTGEIPTT